jgi:hypothetical protein
MSDGGHSVQVPELSGVHTELDGKDEGSLFLLPIFFFGSLMYVFNASHSPYGWPHRRECR